MAVNKTERISTWRRFRHQFRSKTIPLLVFVALTVLTFLAWTRQSRAAARRLSIGLWGLQSTGYSALSLGRPD